MDAVILVIHLIVALGIIAIVLIQPSESGGFLGSSGSMSNMMAPRRSGDVLTRTTSILAVCFFLTSLSLAILAEHRAPANALNLSDQPAADATPMAPAPDESALTAPPPSPAGKAPADTKAPAPKKGKPVAPISK